MSIGKFNTRYYNSEPEASWGKCEDWFVLVLDAPPACSRDLGSVDEVA